jgi:hypothetical protein
MKQHTARTLKIVVLRYHILVVLIAAIQVLCISWQAVVLVRV